jgi:CheY-like chemotaxis protein
MSTVTLQVPNRELAGRMAEMRGWLDEHGFVPTRFRCSDREDGQIAVRLDFVRPDEAAAFLAAFGPKTIAPIAVLVVDDEPDIRLVVSNALAYQGFRVVEAGSASEALYRLRSPEKIDLLFTDIVMPGGIDGFALAQQARELRPDLRVLYTTGYLKVLPGENEASRFGPLLRKPFRHDCLIAEVRRAFG